MGQFTKIKEIFEHHEVSKETLIENHEKYGKCNICKQPYVSEEKWCNDCDTKSCKIKYDDEFKKYKEKNKMEYLFASKMKKFKKLSLNERSRFKQFGLCYKCFQPCTGVDYCYDCESKRYNFKYVEFKRYTNWKKPFDFKMKKFEELSSNERSRFKEFGLCYKCFQLCTGVYSCNDCESKRYNIEYDIEFKKYKENNELEKPFDFKMKKFEELSSIKRSRFKKFGLCHECFQPYPEVEWCYY
ncbi:hypothetical protein C1645_836445, partial [Glomus cerebriforme]